MPSPAAEVNPARVIDLLKDLVRIKSEPETGITEKELAEFIAGVLDGVGLEVKMPAAVKARPNVVGILRGEGEGKSIILNGHLSAFRVEPWTVDPYSGLIRDGELYGVGAVDMKGAIAAMIVAAEAIKKSRQRLAGDVILAFGSGAEESGIIGTKHIVESGTRADVAIVGEPTCLNIVVAQRGAVWTEFTTHGVAGLTGRPGGVNAIEKMNAFVNAIQEYKKTVVRKSHPLLDSPGVSVNQISAGQAPYTIPNRCTAVVDRRLIPGETTEGVVRELSRLMGRVKSKDRQSKVEMKTLVRVEPLEISPEEEIVKVASAAFAEATGRKSKPSGLYGFTEAVHLASAKIKTIVCGPGDMKRAHSPDERVGVQDVVDAAKLYAVASARIGARR